jgi:hypothetical protein
MGMMTTIKLALPVAIALSSGCHAIFHSTDPLHEQIRQIVAIHDQHGTNDGYGEVSREKLTTEGFHNPANEPLATMINAATNSVTLMGRIDDRLCFSLTRNMSAVNGEEGARADAKSRYAAHYAYLFFRDLKEVSDKTQWPTIEATQPLEVSTIGGEGSAGESYKDSEGNTRTMQDSIDVEVKLCAAVPVVPPDAKWFALALVYPHDQEEYDRVMVWKIVDAPPAAPDPE